ncbi:MAG: peptidylprolyl isomerase [Calditrichaeota bacterium]|nr:peptidylprolyl isomerase [Calditrichota bacterium]
MTISKDKVVHIHYTLTNNEGEVLDSSEGREPLAYLHGNGNLISGLENELNGKKKGDKLSVKIQPEDAYGLRDEALIQDVPLSNFTKPDEVEIGIQFQIQTNEGVKIATVVDKKEDEATLDLNHPMAGIELNFDVEIIEVRDASKEELSHGHVHGEGGHHH